MNIETKFYVGQKVIRASDWAIVEITEIRVGYNGFYSYKCLADGKKFQTCHTEDELIEPVIKIDNEAIKKGDRFYYISHDGECKQMNFDEDNLEVINTISQGNAFIAKNDAMKEMKRRCIHEKLKKLTNGHVFDWREPNWYIVCSIGSLKITPVSCDQSHYDPNNVYFKSEKDAIRAINEIGKHRLCKDYFGVADREL